jgi:hypothetical protein
MFWCNTCAVSRNRLGSGIVWNPPSRFAADTESPDLRSDLSAARFANE